MGGGTKVARRRTRTEPLRLPSPRPKRRKSNEGYPVFSCPDGIATLILREVPFRARAIYWYAACSAPGGSACRMRSASAVRRVRSGCSPRAKRIFPAIRPPSAFSGAARRGSRCCPRRRRCALFPSRRKRQRTGRGNTMRASGRARSGELQPGGERALAAGGEALWIWDGAERIALAACAAVSCWQWRRCSRARRTLRAGAGGAVRRAGSAPDVRRGERRAMRLYDRLGFSRARGGARVFSI